MGRVLRNFRPNSFCRDTPVPWGSNRSLRSRLGNAALVRRGLIQSRAQRAPRQGAVASEKAEFRDRN